MRVRTAVLSHGGGLEQPVGQLHPCLLLPELLPLSSGASWLCVMELHDSFRAKTFPGVSGEGC